MKPSTTSSASSEPLPRPPALRPLAHTLSNAMMMLSSLRGTSQARQMRRQNRAQHAAFSKSGREVEPRENRQKCRVLVSRLLRHLQDVQLPSLGLHFPHLSGGLPLSG